VPNQSRSTSFNIPVYYYDILVNEKLFEIVRKDSNKYNVMFNYIFTNLN